MKKNDDNVIDFPKHRKSNNSTIANGKGNLRFDMENKKVMISGSLASILVVMTLLNTSVFSVSSQVAEVGTKNGRSIASISVMDRNTNWEHKLAKSLNKKVKRGIASVGREPSSKEQFRIGELEGKYSVQFTGNSLQAINFIQSTGDIEQPKYINDRYEFLNRNRSVLPIDFKSISLSKSEVQAYGQSEVYRLVSSDRSSHIDVEFKLDQHQRLISMTIKD